MERTRVRPEELQSAAALHHTLNDRQRETLRLVAEGKTNPEIAELLGMTLDGAKWNVSELLTKLGFRSREELAEYYHWHNQPARRLGRWARGFASLPAAKWVAGGASSMAVAGALVIGISLAKGEPELAGASPPFLLEAVITVNSYAETIGTQPTGTNAGDAAAPETTVSSLRWLYEDNDEYRYEIKNADHDIEVVSDGTSLWTYDGQLHVYQNGPVIADYPDDVVIYPTLSMILGPVPGGSLSQLEQTFGQGGPDFRFERMGSETMLGRDVTVFEYSPASRSSSNGVDTSSGIGRLWIDEEAMVILRYDSESPAATFSAVVTTFDDDPDFRSTTFSFEPPPGAMETAPEGEGIGRLVPESESSSSIGRGADSAGGTLGYTTPSGFLHVGYVLEGFRSVEVEEEQSSGLTTSHRVVFESDESPPRSIVLTETVRRSGLTPTEQAGTLIRIRSEATPSVQGYVVIEGDVVRITWAENGHVVVLEGTGVQEVELRAMAGGMTVMP